LACGNPAVDAFIAACRLRNTWYKHGCPPIKQGPAPNRLQLCLYRCHTPKQYVMAGSSGGHTVTQRRVLFVLGLKTSVLPTSIWHSQIYCTPMQSMQPDLVKLWLFHPDQPPPSVTGPPRHQLNATGTLAATTGRQATPALQCNFDAWPSSIEWQWGTNSFRQMAYFRHFRHTSRCANFRV
jgi:hypothetical protein